MCRMAESAADTQHNAFSEKYYTIFYDQIRFHIFFSSF